MFESIRPYGFIDERLARFRYQYKDKFYVIDTDGNTYQVKEEDYKRLKVPIKKI